MLAAQRSCSTCESLQQAGITKGQRGHILGIKSRLDYDLKIRMAKEIDIDKDHLVIGDNLFFQAGREAVSGVLKCDEFVELQQKAEEEIAGLRRQLAENDRLIELAENALTELLVGETA